MNFKEPISTFAYNLISLHHDIMWYIIIIISLVYWSLYKIVKEYSWNSYNKQNGFILLSYWKPLYKIQLFFFFVSISIYVSLLNVSFIFFLKLSKFLDELLLNKKSKLIRSQFIIFFLGKNYFKGLYLNNYNYLLNLNLIRELIVEKFISTYLFSKTSNAIYYYDGYDNILDALKFRHSINLEYVFGFFPTIIISLIIVPSMYLLYSNETDIDPSLTIKIVGNQWYWTYESASCLNLKGTDKMIVVDYKYDSVIVDQDSLVKGGRRLLETDNSLVLPYNVVTRFLISSSDVLHAWSIPELGIKVDAVPGRLNQVITIPSNLGLFYGQCSELCGVSHGFMPIKVNIITLKDYYNWINSK